MGGWGGGEWRSQQSFHSTGGKQHGFQDIHPLTVDYFEKKKNTFIIYLYLRNISNTMIDLMLHYLNSDLVGQVLIHVVNTIQEISSIHNRFWFHHGQYVYVTKTRN